METLAGVHQGNDLGYGKNAKDWMIRSQVLRAALFMPMDAVQRLYGSRFRVFNDLGFKIESGPLEIRPKDERPQPSLEPLGVACCDWNFDRTTGITGLWQPSVHSDVAF